MPAVECEAVLRSMIKWAKMWRREISRKENWLILPLMCVLFFYFVKIVCFLRRDY